MDPAYLAAHAEEDGQHWYFRGRLAVLRGALGRLLPPPPLRLLDIGCGTGSVLAILSDFGDAVGVESNEALLAAARGAGRNVRKGMLPDDLGVAPGSADVVLLLDVAEHLDDDLAGFRAARQALSPDGLLVVTVPAYPWLWSAHDVALGHRRRYTSASLRRVVEAAGYRVERVGHFNTLLFPGLAAIRFWKRLRGDDRHDLRRPGRAVNALLERAFSLERYLVPTPALPFGASLMLVARRS
jgi:SAM-dependent methyltransferase